MPSEVVYKPIEKPKSIYAGGTITPPKFMPSYYEWLSFKSELITKDKRILGGGGSTLIYQVPDDYTLFLTNLSLGSRSDGGGAGFQVQSWIFLGDTYTKNRMIGLCFVDNVTEVNSNSLNFDYPLKLLPKTKLSLFNGSHLDSLASITGFLVKNSDIPNF